MEFNGIPLHPLIVHAAVVFVPLAALFALGYALRPRWRTSLRWPGAVTGAAAAAFTQVAAMTGDDLKHKLGEHSALIEQHEMWAGRLQAGMWVLGGVMVLAAFLHSRQARVGALLRILMVIGGVAVVYLCYQTGDAGARAVWAN